MSTLTTCSDVLVMRRTSYLWHTISSSKTKCTTCSRGTFQTKFKERMYQKQQHLFGKTFPRFTFELWQHLSCSQCMLKPRFFFHFMRSSGSQYKNARNACAQLDLQQPGVTQVNCGRTIDTAAPTHPPVAVLHSTESTCTNTRCHSSRCN